MCTATWSVESGAAILCFNRDESRSRPPADPPAILEGGAWKRLAPIDPVGGGSWLCLNERGLCCFALNNYRAPAALQAPESRLSRGLLPLSLCLEADRAQAEQRLAAKSLHLFMPFFLGLLDRKGVSLFGWDGRKLETVEAGEGIITTSSFRTDEVEAYRKGRYRDLEEGSEDRSEPWRRTFHTEAAHPDPAFNPMMARRDSCTHNLSTIRIGERGASFRYEEVSGENRSLGPPREIRLDCC